MKKTMGLFILIFIILNVLMLIYSLIFRSDFSVGEMNLGWPHRFYHRFKMSGADYYNHGGDLVGLLKNEIYFSAIALASQVVYLIFKRK